MSDCEHEPICQRCKQPIPRLRRGDGEELPQSDKGLTVYLAGGYGEFIDVLPWEQYPHWHYCHDCGHAVAEVMGVETNKMHAC